jgi:hypothetical protein
MLVGLALPRSPIFRHARIARDEMSFSFTPAAVGFENSLVTCVTNGEMGLRGSASPTA